MTSIKNYLSLVKFSHTIFALPFALIGFFLSTFKSDYYVGQSNLNLSIAWQLSSREMVLKLILVLICMVTARSAAMAFNRYLDREWDAKNPRTALREIPKGIIKPESALVFTMVNCVVFITTTWFINSLCFSLSPVALLVVLGYSYTKRFTPLCHIILGIGLALAPIGAYLAVTGIFHWLPVMFSFAVLFWVSGFDIIYSLQDEEFDRSERLYSIPAALGKKNALHVSELLHVLSGLCIISAGHYGNFGWLYWVGVAIFCGMLFYQHSYNKTYGFAKGKYSFYDRQWYCECGICRICNCRPHYLCISRQVFCSGKLVNRITLSIRVRRNNAK
jgi:4-hydroxybenzoate polyprenyltransferase